MSEDRTRFIGSSDIAAILGLNPYKTLLAVWAEKTGELPPKDLSDNEAVEWGNRLERVVGDKYADKNGVKLIPNKRRFYHPAYPFLSCELDNEVEGSDELVECKTANARMSKAWEDEEGAEDAPVHYVCQVMFALGITGRKVGHLAVLIGGQKYIERTVEFDQRVFDQMVAKAVEFWNTFVVPKVMPMQISCKDSDTLQSLFPDVIFGEPVTMDDDANKIVESLESLAEDLASLKGTIEQQKNTLKAMLQENECGNTDRYKITWKKQHRKEYTVAAADFRVLRYAKRKGAKNG